MHCIDLRRGAILASVALAVGCSSGGSSSRTSSGYRPVEVQPSAGATRPDVGGVRLTAPHKVRTWNDVRQQAAERMVSANPQGTYMGVVPDALLAIPVLEIELNGDGSVHRILVLRPPRQAGDTVQLAADAVRRAAPFGDVSHLPRPWKFVETFLFDDARRFKPRSLDQ
ncbi:MAG: hypothetical protein ABIV63_07665 [Caldimonas sp.]